MGPPPRKEGEVTVTPNGDARLLYPFWDIIAAEQGQGQELSMKYEIVDIPLHAYTAGKALFARKTGKKGVLARVGAVLDQCGVDFSWGSLVGASERALTRGGGRGGEGHARIVRLAAHTHAGRRELQYNAGAAAGVAAGVLA